MAETLTQTFLFVDKVQLLNIWLLKERGLPMRVGCLMEELWGLFTGRGGGRHLYKGDYPWDYIVLFPKMQGRFSCVLHDHRQMVQHQNSYTTVRYTTYTYSVGAQVMANWWCTGLPVNMARV